MREIGAFEAKNRLGYLLDLVEQGEEVIITRHGKPVARLAPMKEARRGGEAHAALERIRHRARARRLGPFDWTEWKPLRDEGRS